MTPPSGRAETAFLPLAILRRLDCILEPHRPVFAAFGGVDSSRSIKVRSAASRASASRLLWQLREWRVPSGIAYRARSDGPVVPERR